MKKGVIIIEGHVQGLANMRALSRIGVPTIVVDKGDCVARYSKHCGKYFKCPDYNSKEFIRFLVNLHKDQGLQDWLLLPSNDHAVHNISQNKPLLSSLYAVITEDIATIEKIYNKRELLALASEIGVPIPASVMPVHENPTAVDIRYPIMIKGNEGLNFYKAFKTKAIIIDSPRELPSIWTSQLNEIQPRDYFIQEVIPYDNKTVSMTLFAVKGEIHAYWMGIKLREHPVKFGTATCCKSVFIEELLSYSRKLVTALSYTGVCEIEFLKDSRDGLYKLIEINARTWLWVGLAIKCGVNFPVIIYNFMFSGTIPQIVKYPVDQYWLNIYTDSVYTMKRLMSKMDTFYNVAVSYKKFYEACWDSQDIAPFVMYGLLVKKYLKHR